MRLFVAAYLSRENMDAYQQRVDGLVREVPGVLRSVPTRTHHLTLAFLGEIADSDIDKCSAALMTVATTEAFDFVLGPPSLLLNRGRPRLIRVDVIQGLDDVCRVQAALLDALSSELPGLDTRSKPPHLTLARFRKNARKSAARAVERVLERIDGRSMPARDRFTAVDLVKSTLTPTGPIYETVHQVHLAGGANAC